MASGEITLRDLIAWTDLVSPDPGGMEPTAKDVTNDDPLDREVDWVITARSTAPMLSTVRGGELVLLPERVAVETGLDLAQLVRELSNQPVAGVVLDTDQPVHSPIPLLRTTTITAELESDLNRMLTTRRGDLLRAGTEIERIVTECRSDNASPEVLLRALADHLRFTFTVLSPSERVLVSTSEAVGHASDLPRDTPGRLVRSLRQHRTLVISDLVPDRFALGRLALVRVSEAVQYAFDHEASPVQGHTIRVRLVNQALLTAATDPRAAAATLRRAGIETDNGLRVALAPADPHERDLWPLLTAIGTPHDAGVLGDHAAWLVHDQPHAPSVANGSASSQDIWVVASSPIRDATDLGQAVRQVTFLANARSSGLINFTVVRFDDMAQLGALRLLYDHWGGPTLDEFVTALIGPLLREDRRGQLRSTLRAYLALGGTQRATAEHLGIHRNTLTYRLQQIRDLLTIDPDDPEARLGLQLALLAHELPAPRQSERRQ